jgi:hypothetical protein
MASSKRTGIKLIELIVVVLALVGLASVLLPTLGRSKELAKQAMMRAESYPDFGVNDTVVDTAAAGGELSRPFARVKSFIADIELTPKLSVGTEKPESIYEASFSAKIEATSPTTAQNECEIHLPLPPQIISLAELNVTVNGEPDENVFLQNEALVWFGRLDKDKPSPITIEYSAVGKGIYTLHTPPGKIIDKFETKLTANKSDIRMLELSLQPNNLERKAGKTVYTWKYNRLMLGRPIALDVLGIAPMDRLGELAWLGPISIFIFGVLVALLGMAYRPEKLDKWMLLLIAGAFTGAYPLMYFGQEFLSLTASIFAAGALVLIIIAARAITLFGLKLGIGGVALMAGAIMAITLASAIYPVAQGVLLTIEAIGALVVAMIMLPRAQKSLMSEIPTPPTPTKNSNTK